MAARGELKQTVDQELYRPRRHRLRRLLLLAVGISLLLIVAIFLEHAALPNLTPGYDLSQTVITAIAALTALVGLATIVSGLRRALRGLYPVSRGPGQWRRAIRRARDQRLGAAALIVFGSLIAFFGVAVLIVRMGSM